MLIQDHKAVLQGQQKKETGRLHGRERPGLGVHWRLIIYLADAFAVMPQCFVLALFN